MVQGTARRGDEERVRGVALWLLLLSIFTHAFVPFGSPAQLAAGSAFSVSTAEVSLAPRRDPLAASQGQLREGDDKGSAGADPNGDPAAGIAPPPVVLPAFDNAKPTPPPSSRAADGGAASFSARAPPHT